MFRAAFLPIIRSPEPYIGFGTLYAVVVTVCYQEKDGTQHMVTTTAYNVPKPTYGSELLTMGRKVAPNM